MNESQYWLQIREWETTYGKPKFGAGRYDPTSISATCVRCGKGSGRSSRHHKANDFFFALWMPDVYARRYIEFRPEDTARLCRRCHVNIERYSKPLKAALYAEFGAKGGTGPVKWESISAANKPTWITVEWCEAWRLRFSTLFDKWLSRPLRRKKKRK